jgi:capsular exopolysaccharide synthesis family protein
VAVDESHPVAEQFKLLRTRLFHQMRPRGLNTIQITGFRSGEGKSTLAANLAISVAKDARQTTLLVDLDFRQPTIHRLLGLDESLPGLKSYFLDGVELESVFVSPGIEKLTVLPAGGRLPNAPEIMGSPRMEALVRELKGRYPDRYIIFDTPPISEFPDPVVFSEYVDALLLVARADHTRADQISAAMNVIPAEKVLGLVLNDSKAPEMSYRLNGEDSTWAAVRRLKEFPGLVRSFLKANQHKPTHAESSSPHREN